MRQTVLKCDELEGYIENQFKIRIETTGVQITPMAAQLAAAANEAVENNAAAAQ
jgi:hypothetical protein